MLKVDHIARVCHEANRAYCMTIGDHSQPTWDMAPAWQKSSAVSGVEAALANPDKTPEDSHNGWLADKKKAGWKYGPTKAPEKLEHPCMVPYEQLPPEQTAKDHLFLAVVNALRGHVGDTVPVPVNVPVPDGEGQMTHDSPADSTDDKPGKSKQRKRRGSNKPDPDPDPAE